MTFKTVLRVNTLMIVSLISVLLNARCANAQWLTLNAPQQTPIYEDAFYEGAFYEVAFYKGAVYESTFNASQTTSHGQIGSNERANNEKTSAGREAFNAFGCGECHADLAEPSYQSGFRLIGNLVEASDAPQVSAIALNSLQDRLLPALSSSYDSFQKPAEIVLGGETFVASGRYSSLYLRKVHRSLPSNQRQKAWRSLNEFNAASQERKEAAFDYMLMF